MDTINKVLPAARSWPLFSVPSTRSIERAALAAGADHALMDRAGAAVARLALAVAPHVSAVHIVAGAGNNGGDGLVAAVNLLAAGRKVRVSLVGDLARMPADARHSLELARNAGVSISTDPLDRVAGDAGLIIDALLGIGLRSALRPAMTDAISWMRQGSGVVLSIDVPSGLDADTGHAAGAVVHAHHTLSLLTLKPGLFTAHGRDASGCVWFDDLGVPAGDALPTATLAGPPSRIARLHAQHKGSFGDVAIVGGAPGMTGAALLAARAAHAAGAGRVFVSLLDDATPLVDAMRPELMFRREWWTSSSDSLAAATVVCGCGGGRAVAGALPRLLDAVPRLVLDADALNAVAADSSLQSALDARTTRSLHTVLTPHPLEAARLLGIAAAEVQADRLTAARTLADRFGSIVVLKGSGTIVVAPGGTPSINPTGNAALATAGTGDVLAGWAGGLWSATGEGIEAALDAARHAVQVHGHAADVATAAPLRAGELVEAMWRLGRPG